MTDSFITPGATRAPQLTEADLANLSAQQINQARRLGQLEDVMAPAATTETDSLPAHLWDRLTPHDRATMVRTFGPAIDPTNTDHEGATS